MKTHWKKAFNKEYLGSHDLEDSKDIRAEIAHVEVRSVKNSSGEAADCNVAVFKGKLKPMILNVTNCKTVKKFAGSNFIEDWKNLPVTIGISEVRAFGEVTEGLRIRTNQPKTEKLTPDHKKWADAVNYLKKPGSTIDKIKARYDITDEHLTQLQNEAI